MGVTGGEHTDCAPPRELNCQAVLLLREVIKLKYFRAKVQSSFESGPSMKNRSGYLSVLAIALAVAHGTGEFIALQRVYLLNRFARLRSSWA